MAQAKTKFDVHSLIHSNLKQLDVIHPIKFSIVEGMFNIPNFKMFSATIYYLLNILDVHSSSKLPWPILNKKEQSKFLIGVKNILTEIKNKYPEADLPIISPSFLMNPCGEKFLNFMWKLSKFCLYRTLCQKYGTSEILYPMKKSQNDSLAAVKIDMLQRITATLTQNAVENQIKIDTSFTHEYERQCSLEVENLNQEIKKYEAKQKCLVNSASIPEELKLKLLDKENPTALSELRDFVGSEFLAIEAIVHVLKKTYNNLRECTEIIKVAEDSNVSHLCIDANLLNIYKERFTKKDDSIKFSNFIKWLNEEIQIIDNILNNEKIPDMNYVLSCLSSILEDFQACETSFNDVDSKLRNKMKEVQTNVQVLLNDLYGSSYVPKENQTSVSFISRAAGASGGNVDSSVVTTPIHGICHNIFKEYGKNRSTSSLDFSSKLLLTPEFDKNGEVSAGSIHKSVKKQPSETPKPKNIFTIPSSVLRKNFSTQKKSQIVVSLNALTSSIVRKNKCAQILSCSKLTRNFNSESKERIKPFISKELFVQDSLESTVDEDSMDRTPSRLHKGLFQNFSPDHINKELSESGFNTLESESSSIPQDDKSYGLASNNSLETLPSPQFDNKFDSPAALFCAADPEDSTEIKARKPARKSLDALIQRYKEVRKKMT